VLPYLLLVPAIFALQDSGAIPNTLIGIDKQYQELLRVDETGDEKTLQLLLDDFKVPAQWFIETFGPDSRQELEDQYGDQFDFFRSWTLRILRQINSKSNASFEVMPDINERGHYSAPITTPTSLKAFPAIRRLVTKFGFVGPSPIDATKIVKQITTSTDMFVYVDGKFRFFGMQGYPFWAPAGLSSLPDPCAKDGKQPGGKLIHKVDPLYPEEARQRHVEGIVRMRVEIAKNGSVSGVEIKDGDPLLAESAKQAVTQWRYTPIIVCGKPVEMSILQHLRFKLD
jgi:TonB family protein